MTALLCFVSTFVAVFALGFQSQNVNQGHYWAAAWTSVAIGVSSIFLYKLMPESGAIEILGYLIGGVTGITASMYVHRRTLGSRHAKNDQAAAEKRVADAVLARMLNTLQQRRD